MAMIRRISFAAAAAAAAMLGVAGTAHAVGSKSSDGLGEAPIDKQTCGAGSAGLNGAKDPVGEADWGKAGKVTSGFFYSDKQQERRTDDIVACLKDGQVLLYQNESDGNLSKVHKLAEPGSEGRWKDAVSITAGNFTGSGSNDLFVRWRGGAASLFKNVSTGHKLKEEIQIAPPAGEEGVWHNNVVSITSGKFHKDGGLDDLVVLWTDGEVTRYGLTAAGFGEQGQLRAPDKKWRATRTVAAGHLDGTGDKSMSDLMVRWSDGRVSVYDYSVEKGLHSESFIRPAGDHEWEGGLMAIGNYHQAEGKPTNLRDDLLLRWPNGGLSLFQDTSSKGLGREVKLSKPRP
ncbi:hypothetical protein ACFV4G_27985 [Kitasatospora sp. NPDC059747]|uniref:hypothetical protein n=1 Tax=Kitasatospora sp. NPDC059747 TaxID=3346930 RepID=UPI003659A3F7